MSYTVRCECGKPYPVGAADAGVSFACSCGRTVDVPTLHMLRASAGEQPISPAVQIQGMLLNNELPGTRDCVNCGCGTDHLIRVSVACEQLTAGDQVKASDVMVGCLLFGVLGWFAGILMARSRPPVERGREVSFTLPVRVCEACATDRSLDVIRKDLFATPVYAALLDQYPNAIIARVS